MCSELVFGPLQTSKMGSFEKIVGNFTFYLLSQEVILDVVKKADIVPSQLLPICQWPQGNPKIMCRHVRKSMSYHEGIGGGIGNNWQGTLSVFLTTNFIYIYIYIYIYISS